MDNIGILLERLPPPQLPDSISEEDRQIVLLAVCVSEATDPTVQRAF